MRHGSRYRARLRQIGSRAGRRLYVSASEEQVIVDGFRKSYLDSGVGVRWLGKEVSTSPLDLWIYQEILNEVRADAVVAVATSSARYLADICAMCAQGEVLSLVPGEGASAQDTFVVAREATHGRKSVVVVIGSDSGDAHLGEQLASYSTLVAIGGYLIVEDTQQVSRARAVEAFLERHRDFAVDHGREKFYFTLNPGGFLRRH